MIIPEMIGHTFDVHNGTKFISVFVSENMVGHRLGEFSPTRMFKGHPLKKVEVTYKMSYSAKAITKYVTN